MMNKKRKANGQNSHEEDQATKVEEVPKAER
jgi:hypothetical protein